MAIECIDRSGVPLGYALEHVTLTTEAQLASKPAYLTLYVCRIPACYLPIDLGARESHRDSIVNRWGIPGHLRSQDTPGGIFQAAVRINRCPRAVSHESLAKVRLTCRGTRLPLRRVASGRRFRSPVLFHGSHVKQRIPKATAPGGSEPHQKCFRSDDKRNEN